MSRLLLLPLVVFALVAFGCGKQAEVAEANKPAAVEPPRPQPKPVPNRAPDRPADHVLATTAEKVEEVPEKDLTNEDPGLDAKIEAALPEIDRLDKQTVDSAVTQDNIGQPGVPAPGVPGVNPDTNPNAPTILFGRSGATKSKLIKEGGGNAESERAVALGLAWLARQQKQEGGWEFDAGDLKDDRVAATGLALMPFLAAGFTHKAEAVLAADPKGKYKDTVQRGLEFLQKQCPLSGPNAGRMSDNRFAQAVATIALCEAYGMTNEPVLKPYVQAALNHIQRAQAADGGWSAKADGKSDLTVTGWQLQALHSGRRTRELVIDERVVKKAIKFLDSVAGGSRKAMYGTTDNSDAKPGTAPTAIGLLSRYYLDNWGPSHPGMIDGVAGLVKNPPVGRGGLRNLDYYHHAARVVHFYEGADWKDWNEGPKQADGTRKGGMRDWLVNEQIRKDGPNHGSWDPETGWFGSNTGRLGTTALCVLTLEVYYRELPLYKRSADSEAVKILEDK